MRYKIPVVIDSIFVAANAFLLIFTALRFSTGRTTSFFVALILSAGVAFLFFALFSRRAKKRFLSKEDAKKCESVYRELGMRTYQKAEEFLCRLVEKDRGRTLAPVRGNGKIFYRDEEEDVYYAFFPSLFPVKKEEVFEVWKENPSVRPIKVAVLSGEEELGDFCRSLGVEVPRCDSWFRMMKRQEYFPTTQGMSERKKPSFRKFFSRFLSRKKSKRFFAFGCWMIFLSLIIPFPVYYLIMGSLFLFLSVLARFFGKKESV